MRDTRVGRRYSGVGWSKTGATVLGQDLGKQGGPGAEDPAAEGDSEQGAEKAVFRRSGCMRGASGNTGVWGQLSERRLWGQGTGDRSEGQGGVRAKWRERGI